MFIRLLWQDPHMFVTILFLVTFSICCHEFMHAFVALKFGDDTAARCGHLTLNPLKQMGLMSLIMLLLFGIAWGQVPVNRANLRSRVGRVATILAGPLTNLALWVVFIGLCLATGILTGNKFAFSMLAYSAMINLVLFAFNLLPVPGLDGFNIMIEFFPGIFHRDSEVVKGAYLLLIAILFTSSGMILDLAAKVTMKTLELLQHLVVPA